MKYAYSMEAKLNIKPKDNNLTKQTEKSDKKIIDDFSKMLNVRPFFIVPLKFIVINHYNNNKNKTSDPIIYSPNYTLSAGLGLSYWIFGISFSIAIPGAHRDESVYGKTRSLDFQFNYYFRKFGFDLFYQDYKEYYLENPKKYFYLKGYFPAKRKDLEIETIGGNFFYVFADQFSMDSAFKQCEKQNKSGGSFLLMFSVINYKINSQYPLIPASQEFFYNKDAGFARGNFTSFGLSPGYGHTFIIKNFFITPVFFLGSGLMKKTYFTYFGKRNKFGSFIKANFRLGIGYNSERYYYGFSLFIDYTTTQSIIGGSGISVGNYGGYIETYGGYRFRVQ